MLCLTKSDIQSCFSMGEAIAASKEALKIYSQGNANIPLRANLPIGKI